MIATPPLAGSPRNRTPWATGGRVLIVKEAIEPSGSVPPNPGSRAVLLGATTALALLATGGWLSGVGTGVGVGIGVGTGAGMAAIVAGAGLLRPLSSVAL